MDKTTRNEIEYLRKLIKNNQGQINHYLDRLKEIRAINASLHSRIIELQNK